MWYLLIFIAVFYFFWRRFALEVDYIKGGNLWVLYYTYKQERKMKILFKG